MTVWLYGARTHQNKIMALDNGLQYQLQKLSISAAKFGMAKPEAGRVHFDSISIESKWDVQVETYLTINFSSPQESRTTPLSNYQKIRQIYKSLLLLGKYVLKIFWDHTNCGFLLWNTWTNLYEASFYFYTL